MLIMIDVKPTHGPINGWKVKVTTVDDNNQEALRGAIFCWKNPDQNRDNAFHWAIDEVYQIMVELDNQPQPP